MPAIDLSAFDLSAFLGGDPWFLATLIVGLLFVGAVAGVLAGLLGVSGGIVIVPVLFSVLGILGVPVEIRMHVTAATSLAAIIVPLIISARTHAEHNAIDMDLAKRWAPFVLVGTIIGIIAANRMNGSMLAGIFGVFGLAVAADLLRTNRPDHGAGDAPLPSASKQGGIAALIGFFSTLMGLGGGTLTVSVLNLFHYPIHRAVATSTLFGLIIAVPATIGYIAGGSGVTGLPPGSLGYVNLIGLVVISITMVLTAPWGVRLAHKFSPRNLRLTFAIFLGLISIKMLIDGPTGSGWIAVLLVAALCGAFFLYAAYSRRSFSAAFGDVHLHTAPLRLLAGLLHWRNVKTPLIRGTRAVMGDGFVDRTLALNWPRVGKYGALTGMAAVIAVSLAVITPAFFIVVGPGQEGIIQTFGKVTARDLQPGLYAHLPPPFGRGHVLDADNIEQVLIEPPAPDANAVGTPIGFYFLTSDENVIELIAAVQYRMTDPYRAAFITETPDQVIIAHANQILASLALETPVDRLYSTGRVPVETIFEKKLEARIHELNIGYEVVAARLVSVHAPSEVHESFRDVSSAIEDRTRLVFEADGDASRLKSEAVGRAAEIVASARAQAVQQVRGAEGTTTPFSSLAAVHATAPALTEQRLLLETFERKLGNQPKFINGLGSDKGEVDLWVGGSPVTQAQLPFLSGGAP